MAQNDFLVEAFVTLGVKRSVPVFFFGLPDLQIDTARYDFTIIFRLNE